MKFVPCKDRPKVGERLWTMPNLSPKKEADKWVEVISFDDFSKGTPCSSGVYHWSMLAIQRAVFIRFLEGPLKDTVAMAQPETIGAKE